MGRLRIAIFMGILVAGATLAWWTVDQAEHWMRAEMLGQVRMVARAMDPDRIQGLSGTPADLAKPDYLRLKAQLVCTRKIYSECRFIYLMGRRPDGRVFFFADSEPSGTAAESPAGQLYEEVSPQYLQAFDTRAEVVTSPVTDRWGTWISALVPIFAPHDEELVALVGMDVGASRWRATLWQAALPPMLLTLFMAAMFLMATLMSSRASRAGGARRPQTVPIEPVFAALAGMVLTGFGTWMAHTNETRNHRNVFAQVADTRTAAITAELSDLCTKDLESLAHFYASSTKVTAEEFRRFTAYLMKNPVVAALGWIPAVVATEPNGAEAAPNEAIWQISTEKRAMASIDGSRSSPVLPVPSVSNDTSAPAHDPASQPAFHAAIEEAIRTGLPSVAVPIHLAGDEAAPGGMMICRPVYGGLTTNRLQGFAAVMLRMGTLLKMATSAHSADMAFIHLRADTTEERLVSAPNEVTAMSFTHPIFACGETFALKAAAGLDFLRLHPRRTAYLTALNGTALTAAFTFVIATFRRRRQALERLVGARNAALMEQETSFLNFFEQLFHHNPSPVALSGLPDGCIQDVNEAFLAVTGYSRNEVIGKTSNELGIFADPRQRQTAGDLLRAKGRIAGYEMQVRRKDGALVDGLFSGGIVQLKGCPYYLTLMIDISEQKAAERKLRSSEARYRMFFDQSPDGIVTLDPSTGRVLEFNDQACRQLGYCREKFGKLTVTDIDVDESPAETAARIQGVLQSGRDDFMTRHRTRDGKIRQVRVTAQAYQVENETVYHCIWRDVTETLAMEEQLRQAQKVESVGRLAGGVAHDLNNLLTPILGYSELLAGDLGAEDRRRLAVNEIRRAGIRARDLVRQLLAFSRKQALEYTTFNLNHGIRKFEKLLRRTIREDIAIEMVLASELPDIRADLGQIEQVIMNLAVNAADAMPGGGKLTIETAAVVLDEAYVALHPDTRTGQYMILSVSDTGCGMDEAIREHIFEPFFSTKGESGTGLGLATVYGIVKQHGGHIELDSEPGRGTTFRIYLPASDKAPGDKRTEKHPLAGLHGSETILLAEDNEPVRQLAEAILRSQGYMVLTASSGTEALALLDAHPGSVDLLLTDVVMPETNGKELYGGAVKKHPALKVLYMSGYTDDVIVHHGVLEEGVHFIQKPFTVQGLAAKVREVLDG